MLQSVQESNPADREGDGREILLPRSLQKIRSHLVQPVAEPVIGEGIRTRFKCRCVEGESALLGQEKNRHNMPGAKRLRWMM